MLEYLIELDKVVFLLFNYILANPVTNFVMPIITDDNYLRIIFVLIGLLLLVFGDRKQRWLVLFAGITMVLTDQTAAGFLKPLIERARPCHLFAPEDLNLLVGCGSGYAMPSAHAANVFGQAALISMYVRFTRWPLYLFAILVASSRVFVGVHYPGDILMGALVGVLAGKLVGKLFDLFDRKVLTPPKVKATAQETTDDTAEEDADADQT